jgi:DtxR family Mn-dependent transcriptional regulator
LRGSSARSAEVSTMSESTTEAAQAEAPATRSGEHPSLNLQSVYHHHHSEMSESEQMYLITAAMLVEDGMEQPIPLSAMAHARSIMPASVNQMVRKLADAGLLTYVPYKGIELTPAGTSIATRILRYRRLWETFLVKKLRLAGTTADALACRLEHLTTDEVAERLDQYLGEPQVSPQGKPIPRVSPVDEPVRWVPLNHVRVGHKSKVLHLNIEPATRAFLAGEGLVPGAVVKVAALGATGAVLVEIAGHNTHLSLAIAVGVLVQPLDPE